VQVNDAKGHWIFDTGANFSTLTSSPFTDETVRPIFFPSVPLMKPRSECGYSRVRMKKTKTKNKILYFPPPKEPIGQTITCQAGTQRFAIHMQVEDLPPLPPVIQFRSPPRKSQPGRYADRAVSSIAVLLWALRTGDVAQPAADVASLAENGGMPRPERTMWTAFLGILSVSLLPPSSNQGLRGVCWWEWGFRASDEAIAKSTLSGVAA
jgi:hypothetical protein